ncbi:PLAT domain-containing protein 1-like [Neltuma alba]|uniref:PLAT domain-containing protein 1-like n=1 Tax=Neltuma alba TaxID=207710 RepID=UPI0010A5732F|nr:PLAT domain-containing protein 1-like [Prosopis alba]
MAIPEDCEYEVSVQTGDVPKAQTGSRVSLKLVSCSGKNFTVNDLLEWLQSPRHTPYQRGQLDVFKGNALCLDPCAMIITNHAGPDKVYSGWYLEYVDVKTGDSTSPVHFPVYRWLANDVPPNALNATVNNCNCSDKLKSALSAE